jgi:hypothetical protein
MISFLLIDFPSILALGWTVPARFHYLIAKDCPDTQPLCLVTIDALDWEDLDKFTAPPIMPGGVRNAVACNLIDDGRVHLKVRRRELSASRFGVFIKQRLQFFHRRSRRDFTRYLRLRRLRRARPVAATAAPATGGGEGLKEKDGLVAAAAAAGAAGAAKSRPSTVIMPSARRKASPASMRFRTRPRAIGRSTAFTTLSKAFEYAFISCDV